MANKNGSVQEISHVRFVTEESVVRHWTGDESESKVVTLIHVWESFHVNWMHTVNMQSCPCVFSLSQVTVMQTAWSSTSCGSRRSLASYASFLWTGTPADGSDSGWRPTGALTVSPCLLYGTDWTPSPMIMGACFPTFRGSESPWQHIRSQPVFRLNEMCFIVNLAGNWIRYSQITIYTKNLIYKSGCVQKYWAEMNNRGIKRKCTGGNWWINIIRTIVYATNRITLKCGC